MNLDQSSLFDVNEADEPMAQGQQHPTIFVVLDLETTGLDSRSDRIIEVGAVRFTRETPTAALFDAERLDVLVNPGIPIPKEISDLTGITDADVAEAPPIARVVPQIREFLAPATCFVAHSTDFEVAFLTANGVDTGHLQVLDTRDLVVMCQPSVTTTALSRVASIMKLQQGGHRAFADACQTAQMLSMFLAEDFLGGLSDKAINFLLRSTSKDWPYRILFQDEAQDRNLETETSHLQLSPPDLAPVHAHSPSTGPVIQQPDSAVEEQITGVLNAGEATVIPVSPQLTHTHGLAAAISSWVAEDDRRILVAVPTLAGTGIVGSLFEALASTVPISMLACLIEPKRCLDLDHLQDWISGRTLDTINLYGDFGESRLLTKLLNWSTHCTNTDRQQLRFLSQVDMGMLSLDQSVHWPAIRGNDQSDPESLVPRAVSRIGNVETDPTLADVVVADHATLIHTVLNDPEFAADFDAIVVEDLWHLARLDSERERETHSLSELSYLIARATELIKQDTLGHLGARSHISSDSQSNQPESKRYAAKLKEL